MHCLLAVHITDGVLALPWIVGGFVLAAMLAVLGGHRLKEDEIPKVAVLSAAFFVASVILVPIPLPFVRAHPLLNGLVGVVLGRRAAVAIPLALFLQAVLLQHGGISSLGVNACVMVLPALAAWLAFAALRRTQLLTGPAWQWLAGFALGLGGVMLTATLNSLVLWLGGSEDWPELAAGVLLVHVPIAVVEGFILAATIRFLARVKPEMIGLK